MNVVLDRVIRAAASRAIHIEGGGKTLTNEDEGRGTHMVPGAIGLVVGGGPLTQYASPTTMFVPYIGHISWDIFRFEDKHNIHCEFLQVHEIYGRVRLGCPVPKSGTALTLQGSM